MTDPVSIPANGSRLVVLVEWKGPEMSPADAHELARSSLTVLNSVPGLDEARIFGDFETGTHCFLLTWRDRESMERYMASEAMHAVRGPAQPFVTGTPTRRTFVDYGAVAERSKAK